MNAAEHCAPHSARFCPRYGLERRWMAVTRQHEAADRRIHAMPRTRPGPAVHWRPPIRYPARVPDWEIKWELMHHDDGSSRCSAARRRCGRLLARAQQSPPALIGFFNAGARHAS